MKRRLRIGLSLMAAAIFALVLFVCFSGNSPSGSSIKLVKVKAGQVYYAGKNDYVTATSGSTVYAGKGSHVTGQAGSHVFDEAGGTVSADKGSNVVVESGGTANIYPGSKVDVEAGARITLEGHTYLKLTNQKNEDVSVGQGSTLYVNTFNCPLFANTGDGCIQVTAYDGSTVYAGYNAEVYTKGKATVIAWTVAAEVHAGAESTVYASDQAVVEASYDSTIYAYNAAVVYAQTGSTVYAYKGSYVIVYPGAHIVVEQPGAHIVKYHPGMKPIHVPEPPGFCYQVLAKTVCNNPSSGGPVGPSSNSGSN